MFYSIAECMWLIDWLTEPWLSFASSFVLVSAYASSSIFHAFFLKAGQTVKPHLPFKFYMTKSDDWQKIIFTNVDDRFLGTIEMKIRLFIL